MDKALRDYTQHIEAKLKKWPKLSVAERRQLYKFHLIKVRDFQHERLVHLIVTLFFGFLFLFSLVLLFASQVADIQIASFLGLGLSILLFITLIFYIRYYYLLENGVQKLYAITDKLTP